MRDGFPPALHELETEIMEELWEHDEGTVRSVLEALNGRSQPQRAYTTILTVMQRLAAKELLRRNRRGRRDVYLPAMSREEYMRARAELGVDAVVSEFGDLALAQFSRRMARLDPKHRRQVSRLARGG